jgi:hypothetical protein
MQKVIDAIEQNKSRFHIKYYGYDKNPANILKFIDLNTPECETVCCIAGWANAIRMHEKASNATWEDFFDDEIKTNWENWRFHKTSLGNIHEAARYLDLPYDFAYELFHPRVFLRYLRGLADHLNVPVKTLSTSFIYESLHEDNPHLKRYPWLMAFTKGLIRPECYIESCSYSCAKNLVWPDFWSVSAEDAITVLKAILNEDIPVCV